MGKRADKKLDEIRAKNEAAARALGIDLESFGNPDELIDALGAQRTLEVVGEDGLPIDASAFDSAGFAGEAGVGDGAEPDGARSKSAGASDTSNVLPSDWDGAIARGRHASHARAGSMEALEDESDDDSGLFHKKAAHARPSVHEKMHKPVKRSLFGERHKDDELDSAHAVDASEESVSDAARMAKRPSVHDEWEHTPKLHVSHFVDEDSSSSDAAGKHLVSLGAAGATGAKVGVVGSSSDGTGETDVTEEKLEGEAPTDDSTPKKPHKKRKPLTPGRVIARIILTIVLVILLVLAVFSWDRWLRFNDAADLQGVWYAPGGTAPVTITADTIILNDEVSYPYTLDTTAKTIHYEFKNADGISHYRFSSNGDVLVIVEGGDSTWISTLMEDLAVMRANASSKDGEVFALEGEDPLVLYKSELAAETAYQNAQIKASRDAQSQAREAQSAAIAEQKAQDEADAKANSLAYRAAGCGAEAISDTVEKAVAKLKSRGALAGESEGGADGAAGDAAQGSEGEGRSDEGTPAPAPEGDSEASETGDGYYPEDGGDYSGDYGSAYDSWDDGGYASDEDYGY